MMLFKPSWLRLSALSLTRTAAGDASEFVAAPLILSPLFLSPAVSGEHSPYAGSGRGGESTVTMRHITQAFSSHLTCWGLLTDADGSWVDCWLVTLTISLHPYSAHCSKGEALTSHAQADWKGVKVWFAKVHCASSRPNSQSRQGSTQGMLTKAFFNWG